MTINVNSRPFSYAGAIMISCFLERTRIVMSSSCISAVSFDLVLRALTAPLARAVRRMANDEYCRASSCSRFVLQVAPSLG